MAAYILVEIAVHDAPGFERYRETVVPSIVAYGGRFVVGAGRSRRSRATGSPSASRSWSFRTARARGPGGSRPEYAEPKALRLATASSRMILVDGV